MTAHKRLKVIPQEVRESITTMEETFSFFKVIRCRETSPECFTGYRHLAEPWYNPKDIMCASCANDREHGTALKCQACRASMINPQILVKTSNDVFVTFIGNSDYTFCYSCAAMWTLNRKALQRQRLPNYMPAPRARFDYCIEYARRQWQTPRVFLLVMKRWGYPLPRDVMKEILKLLA